MNPVRSRLHVLGLVVALFTAVLIGSAGTAGAAAAAPAQGQCGNTTAAPRLTASRTTIGVNETAVVTVTGSSYLVPPHVCGTNVFGGVYLFFGWVKPGGQWGPSFRNSTSPVGLFGETYSYPGEGGGAETRDDGSGVVRLISFTAGGESGDATDFHMDGSGNWQSSLTVRGATYTFKDVRTGTSHSVDCRVVQCGVFTIGAHGKASRTNEQFTPITFTGSSGAPIPPSNPGAGGGGGSTGAPSGGATPDGHAAPTPSTAPGPGGSTGDDTSGPDTPVADTAGSAGSSVGSVGDAPTTTAGTEVAGASETADAEPLDSEEVAAVQEFGDSTDGSGGGAAMALGIGVALLAVAGVGVLIARRRNAGTTEVAP